jgi:hypothetical protein
MINSLLLLVLTSVLLAPPVLLRNGEERFSWTVRYAMSILPVAYTFLGWHLAAQGHDFFGCHGNPKDIHDCIRWGIDFTAIVGHGWFLMVSCGFIALPLSLWLLLNTSCKQIGAWHKKNYPNGAP